MGDNLVSDLRRSRSAADDLGGRIGNASDEARRLGRANVDDIFRRARSGADDLRRSASRADDEIRGMSDSRVHIKAQDGVSPVIDGISSKLTTLAATAGAILIGGGIKDALFGNVMDYYSEAARSATVLPERDRLNALQVGDQLHAKGLVASQAQAAGMLGDLSPMVRDKSKAGDMLSSAVQLQFLIPDASIEEIGRGLSQSANTFKESYASVADSMAYAYSQVGDPQKDLFDTFWEYSGYFKNTGANSGQMANFLTQSVKEGAFNFDKPADFIKETFGVKALDSGDMEKYFTLRGAGKNDAAKQAASFTGDINSGDEQRAKGALMALVGDLASQTQSQLKASLVSLGSATAEDNGNAILKTFQVPFQPAPAEISGTTDRMVKAQQDANPMTSIIQTRAQIDQQIQDLGANLSTAVLPALKEFNTLISENKDQIQVLGEKVVGFISKLTSFYSEHFNVVNGVLGVAAGGLVAVKGGRLLQKGYTSVKTAKEWIGQKRGRTTSPTEEVGTPARRRFTLRRGKAGGSLGGLGGALSSLSSMTVNAGVVYLNESGGLDGHGGGRRNRRGGRRGSSRRGRSGAGAGGLGGNAPRGNRNPNGSVSARRRTRSPVPPDIDTPDAGQRRTGRVTYRNSRRLPPVPDPIPDTPPARGGFRSLFKGGTKAVKALGVLGTAAGIGMAGYDLYQASQDKGWKDGIASTGGSLLGGATGGVVGGIVGSLAGPIGTAAGATVGGMVGEKIGSWADSSGITKSVVDGVVTAAGGIKDAAASIGSWLGITKQREEKKLEVMPPTEAKVTFGSMTPQQEEKLKASFSRFSTDVAKNGLLPAFKGVIEKSGVLQSVDKVKSELSGVWKNTESSTAQNNIIAMGSAAKGTSVQAQLLGSTAKTSTDSIVAGASAAGVGLLGIGTSVKIAADETKQQLQSIQTVTSQSQSWGSGIITGISQGMQSKFPELKSTAMGAMGILSTLTGTGAKVSFGAPTSSSGGAKYANGGVINRPHLGLVGEAGPEAIIPLSAGRRQRGVELWEKAGAMLGVRAYANGGIVGAQPLRTHALQAKTFIDDNNDNIGYGAGYAEGIHGSLDMVKKYGAKRYTRSLSKAASLTDAYKIRATGHRLRRQASKMRRFAKGSKLLGKIVRPVGYAMDAWDVLFAGKGKKGRQLAKVVGGIGGGMAGGAATGALLGTFLMPGVGTAVGGAIGGLVGTIGGEKLATKIFDGISGFFRRRKKRKKKYADGGLISSPHMGLVGEAGPEMIIPLSRQRSQRGRALWEQAGSLLGVRPYANGGAVGMRSSGVPVAQTLAQAPASTRDIVIENINIDFGELAKGITNFAEFAKMLTSSQGRALFRKIFGEELYKALESGG